MSEGSALRIEEILGALDRHRVAYVVTGSVAAMAYGVALVPGDLDIAPDLESENLGRLACLLREIAAKPKFVATWKRGPSLEACEHWTPDPANAANLDHRFVTDLGELDVVPRMAGSYEDLAPRAVSSTAFGVPLLIAHPDDLIALCMKWNRDTDRERLPALEEARRRFDERGLPDEIGNRLNTNVL